MTSKEFMYFLNVGVGNIFQNGIFSSMTPTFLKKHKIALISSWVPGGASPSSRQPNRTSRATLAMAKKNLGFEKKTQYD